MFVYHVAMQIFYFFQTYDDKITALEGGEGIEPILTCVQCSAKYKESENAGLVSNPGLPLPDFISQPWKKSA